MHLNIKRQQIIIDSMYILVKSARYKNRAHETINLLLIVYKTPFTMIWFLRVQHAYFLALIQGNAKSLVLREQTYCEWIGEYFSLAMKSTVLLFHNGFSIFTLKVCSTMLCNHVREETYFPSAVAENEPFPSYLELYPCSPATCSFPKSPLKWHAICLHVSLPVDNVWDPNIRISFLR